jgi:hypothetical protein
MSARQQQWSGLLGKTRTHYGPTIDAREKRYGMKKKIVFDIDLSDVINFNEDLVVELLEKFLDPEKDTCRCQNCLEDMYSLSLKMIEPRYHPNAVTEKVSGTGAYESAQSAFNKKAEKEVIEAIKIVSNNPHH